MVLLLAMFCVHNESNRAWKMFCTLFIAIYDFPPEEPEEEPEEFGEQGGGGGGAGGGGAFHPHRIDSAQKVMIADAHPSITAMFEGDNAVFKHMLRTLCEYDLYESDDDLCEHHPNTTPPTDLGMDHRKDHVPSGGGGVDKYVALCMANTSRSFWNIMEESSPSFQTWVHEVDLWRQFPICMKIDKGVSMHGHLTSQGSEVMMSANLKVDVRKLGADRDLKIHMLPNLISDRRVFL